MTEIAQRFGIWIGPRSERTGSAFELPSNNPSGHQSGIVRLVRSHQERKRTAGIAWQFPGRPIDRLDLGAPLSRRHSEELGIIGVSLTRRQIAFLLAVAIEGNRDRVTSWMGLVERRDRIRERLGMTDDGFEKWVKRNLTLLPGRILRWSEERTLGRGPARSEGTWWVAARELHVEPDVVAAEEFIREQAEAAALRADDPEALLQAAEASQELDNWPDAYDRAVEAAILYARRDWSRADPRWFRILFAIGGIEMQLGRPGLKPTVSINVERSLRNPKQRLAGPDAQVLRAKAHHLAALVHNQMNDSKGAIAAMRELELAKAALKGLATPAAVHQRWDTSVYEELTRARASGTAVAPTQSSSIWQSIKYFRDSGDLPRSEQERMRYGESLLCAGRACEAIDHLDQSLDTTQLTTAARVIAERVRAMARWATGGAAERALDALEVLEREVRALSFSHQVRTIQQERSRIQLGLRRMGKLGA